MRSQVESLMREFNSLDWRPDNRQPVIKWLARMFHLAAEHTIPVPYWDKIIERMGAAGIVRDDDISVAPPNNRAELEVWLLKMAVQVLHHTSGASPASIPSSYEGWLNSAKPFL